tara:strand:+ start:48 stop:410 length:363 start_codon:yes stop_codon:yes gene_type:complete
MDNRKITLGIAGAMVLSLFLPFVKVMGFGASLFDIATKMPGDNFELVALIALVIGFAVTTFMGKPAIARICSGLILLACIYSTYKVVDAGAAGVFEVLAMGAYILVLSSIAGVIFSKSDS